MQIHSNFYCEQLDNEPHSKWIKDIGSTDVINNETFVSKDKCFIKMITLSGTWTDMSATNDFVYGSYVSNIPSQSVQTNDDFFTSGEINSSTASLNRPHETEDELREILATSPRQSGDDTIESTVFARRITEWYETYGKYAVELVDELISVKILSNDVISDILVITGNLDSSWSLNGRRSLLEKHLRHASPKIRYGAIAGLSNLNDPRSISVLTKALKEEKNRHLKNVLRSTLNQFKDQ